MLISCLNCNAKIDVFVLLKGCPSCKYEDRINFGTIIENLSPYALTNACICDICSRPRTLCSRTFKEKCICATKIRNEDQFHLLCMSGKREKLLLSNYSIVSTFARKIEDKVKALINVQLIAEALQYSVTYGAFIYLFCGPNCLYFKECGNDVKEVRSCFSLLKTDPEGAYKKMYIESLIDGSNTVNVLEMLWDSTLYENTVCANRAINATIDIDKSSYNGSLFICKKNRQ